MLASSSLSHILETIVKLNANGPYVSFCLFFSWPEIDWTALYWDGVDRARAVQQMLEVGESDSQKFTKYHRAEMEKHRIRTN